VALGTAACGQAATILSSGKEYGFFVSDGRSWNSTGDSSFLGCNAVFTGKYLAAVVQNRLTDTERYWNVKEHSCENLKFGFEK
jgi:hypothetical protein